MEERRKSFRKPMKLKVVLASESEPSHKARARSFNISFDGIGLRLRKLFRIGDRLQIAIHSRVWDTPLRATGELVWQTAPRIFTAGAAGIRFLEAPFSRIKELTT